MKASELRKQLLARYDEANANLKRLDSSAHTMYRYYQGSRNAFRRAIEVLDQMENEPPQESYAARQAAWIEANGIEVGSRVRVVRKAESREDGWGLMWTSRMDKFIGQAGKVVGIPEHNAWGIAVEFEQDGAYFPYFVLEPVEPAAPQPPQVREDGWYRRRDGKVVGPARRIEGNVHCKWRIGNNTYTDAGYWNIQHEPLAIDLIAEVPPPSEAPVMETPDKVLLLVDPDNPPKQEDGYRFLGVGETIAEGDEQWSHREGPWKAAYTRNIGKPLSCIDYPHRRRITPEPEREATYRAFRSAEEFNPHRDRWIRRALGQGEYGSAPGCVRVVAYDNHGYWFGSERESWSTMLEYGHVFDDDGTPCGIKEQI